MLVVTGGGGFIGSVLAAELNEAGHADLVIVDHFGSGDKWRNIAKREFSDIVPVEGLPAWLERFGGEVEAVFHLGANSSTFANDADDIIATNLNASIALFKSHRPDYRDGEQRRDFVYVKDCVAAMLRLWRQGRNSGIYNLGTGEARSFLDLINALGAACGVAPKIEFIDIPPDIRPSYQYFTEAQMSRLRQAGYNAPFTPLEAAVHDFVTNHLAQSDPYV